MSRADDMRCVSCGVCSARHNDRKGRQASVHLGHALPHTTMRLYDSELHVMDVLWELKQATAGEIAKILKDRVGWSRNTTYTVIGKLVKKGAVERTEPKFTCTPLVTRSEVQQCETDSLIDRMFGGSRTKFFAAFLRDEHLTAEELSELRELIDREEDRS